MLWKQGTPNERAELPGLFARVEGLAGAAEEEESEGVAMNEWLEKLKASDTVIIRGNYNDALAAVDRLTATQIVIGNRRFNISNGYERGSDGWRRCRLAQATTEAVEKIRRRRLVEKLSRLSQSELEEVSTEVLAGVEKLLFPMNQ